MPLLPAHLGNTLIDRAGAFSRWARAFAAARVGGPADAQWLVAADRDGLESRERPAALTAGRFGLDGRADLPQATRRRRRPVSCAAEMPAGYVQ